MAQWEQLQALLPKRAQQLADEIVKQQSHEHLRLAWAKHAQEVQDWVSSQDGAIQTVVANASGAKMDDQVIALKAIEVTTQMSCHCSSRDVYFQDTLASNKEQFETLEGINKQIQDNLILDNKHSQVSIEDIRGLNQHLTTKLKQLQNEVNNQVALFILFVRARNDYSCRFWRATSRG